MSQDVTQVPIAEAHAGQGPGTEPAPGDRRALLAGIGGLAAVALLAGTKSAQAGPLNPPAGPITSTGKTLTQVEPRTPISGPTTISANGAYYLTNNITGAAGQDVISIQAIDVDLDLNGFTISGGRTGVINQVLSATGNVVIRNGTIRDTSGSGIFSVAASTGAQSPPTIVRDITLSGITDTAIFLGNSSVVERVRARGALGSTSSSGIRLGGNGRISDVLVENVAQRGINVSAQCQIDRATITNVGTDGLVTGFGCRVSNVVVSGTGSVGFLLGVYNTILSCTAASTTGVGFALDTGSTAKDCTATNNSGDGFNLAVGCSVLDSTATSLLGNGFVVGLAGGVYFDRCSVFNVGLNAFQLSGGCVMTNCAAALTGSLSTFGGPISSGALVTGNGNRIEGNRFANCGYPVFIAAGTASNSVYRNAAVVNLNGYTNNGGASNLLGTIRIATPAVGPWDNTFQ